MKNLLAIIALFLFILLWAACDRQAEVLSETLRSAEELMESRPDSALALLEDSLTPENIRSANRHDRALYALLLTRARHKNFIDESNDSLISIATSYFSESADEHSAMLAWYYNGIIKTNAKSYASAIISLLKAEELADRNNEYRWLGRIRLAIADIYSVIYSHIDEIKYDKLACESFVNASDSLNLQYARIQLAAAYNNANFPDSAILLEDRIYDDALSQGDSIFMSESLVLKSRSHMRLEEYGKAVDVLERLFDIFPEQNTSHNQYLYILALWNSGHDSRAVEKIRQVKNLYGDNAYVPHDILFSIGDIRGAYFNQQKQLELSDMALDSIISQNVFASVSDYTEREIQMKNTIHEKDLMLVFTLVVLMVVLLFLFGYAVVSHRKKQRLKEDRLLELASELQSLIADKNILKNDFDSLEATHINAITILCETYYESNQKRVIKSSTAEAAFGIIRDFAESPDLFQFLEQRANLQNDDLVNRFRAEMGGLTQMEYNIFTCCVLNMSVTAMQLILNLNRNTFYTMRRRLRNKIGDSHPNDEALYLKFLS